MSAGARQAPDPDWGRPTSEDPSDSSADYPRPYGAILLKVGITILGLVVIGGLSRGLTVSLGYPGVEPASAFFNMAAYWVMGMGVAIAFLIGLVQAVQVANGQRS